MSVSYTPPGMPVTTGAPTYDPTNVMGRRIVAYLIDWVIPVVLGIVLFVTLAESLDKSGTIFEGVDMCSSVRDAGDATLCFETDDSVFAVDGGETALVFGVPILVSLLNYVLLQGITGASVGKLIMGLRVVTGDGSKAGFGRQVVRWLLLLVVDSQCLVIGLIVASLTHPHRRVGDMVAGTYVVGKQDAGRPVVPQVAVPPGGYAPQPYSAPYQAAVPAAPPPSGFGAPAAAPGTSAPTWDAQRGCWVLFDAPRNAWLRYDDATTQWVPLD
jgi:uncharacterized RDD family membrane protein YckC